MDHPLKILPEFFSPIKEGKKCFEIRAEHERKFSVNDTLTLREYDPYTGLYTDRFCRVLVTYLTRDKRFVKDGYVVMSILCLFQGSKYEEQIGKLF